MTQKFWVIGIAGLLHACTGEYFLKQNSCPEGEVRKGPICVTTNVAEMTKYSASCVDPDLSGVKAGMQITLCDGSVGTGTLKFTSELPTCSRDGEQECVTRKTFKAVDIASVLASDLRHGKTIAGIAGTLRQVKQCRSASSLSSFDSSPASSSIKVPNYISSFAGSDGVVTNSLHGLTLNYPIQLLCNGGTGTGLPGGQVFTGVTYYTFVVSGSTIQFQATPSGGALSVTGVGGCTGTWVVAPAPDGIANTEDTIDDNNGSSASSPSNSPWTSDYVCIESNFVNVSGPAPLAPSNTTPALANKSWSQIWQDQLTGLYVTNILYDAVPINRDWWELNAMCKGLDSLNGGSGGTGWRLPTLKELMQLHIDGISKVSVAGGTTNANFWSSTAVSTHTALAWTINLSSGLTFNGYGRAGTVISALCVR